MLNQICDDCCGVFENAKETGDVLNLIEPKFSDINIDDKDVSRRYNISTRLDVLSSFF
jgi:hypothetical protein